MARYDEFRGKVALVTGSGAGIGRATAIAFARNGASVVVADLDAEHGEATATQVREQGVSARFVLTDVTRDVDNRQMVERAVEAFGRLDYAFNNAGVTQPARPTHEQPEELFDRVIAINLKGTWLGMRHEIPQMLRQGGGVIVNMSSIAGVTGFEGGQIYSASKHANVGLTRSAALEYAKQGVRVNAVGPGTIDTQMIEDFIAMNGSDRSVMTPIHAAHPLGRMGTSEEVAEAVLWLCSDAANFVTGHLLMVDGGYSAR
jgi:NAD(P)-dependent dehydrogenase (short-subunit alcohol dehydrogenase family)